MSHQTHKLHVHGMHCKSCVILTESELSEVSYITGARSNLHTRTVEVTGDFGAKTAEEIARELSPFLEKHGYKLAVEPERHENGWKDFRIALPVAAAFMVLFFILQKTGLVNLVDSGSVNYGTAFVIGIIASLSTCMAVVGGLVLSVSAVFAREGDKIKPQLMFHIGRIVSFFILGGVIGAIGVAFALNTTSTFILGLIVGLVMLVMGMNLLGIFHWSKKLAPAMPKFLSKQVLSTAKLSHTLAPLLVGAATFFLPCGFTQSMQIYTLTTGGFIEGGLTMLAFALGTLPVLALLSFSSFSIRKSSRSGIFFKTAGLIVIMFALYNLFNSFVVIGVLPPLLNL